MTDGGVTNDDAPLCGHCLYPRKAPPRVWVVELYAGKAWLSLFPHLDRNAACVTMRDYEALHPRDRVRISEYRRVPEKRKRKARKR